MSGSNAHWTPRQKAQLIFEAIKNKYSDADNDMLWRLVLHLVAGTSVVYEQEGDMDFAPVENVRSDILSQVATLAAIERDDTSGRGDLVRWIQGHLLGRVLVEGDFRTDEFVEDFGGRPSVAVVDIPAALHELELLCSWAIAAHVAAPDGAKAALLAYLYSSVIRIHPFCDANGRTARFLVQYALRVWSKPLMPIPKVRNDRLWHDALGQALKGDFNPLAEEFRCRLES